ncbi:MAG TPA: DUF4832 domain-containing protein [Chitinophagaceae bacterium]|jgi:hypothetical protein|nr:DUF4832 domain-containing protein [Chitinophagaceae bacterium]
MKSSFFAFGIFVLLAACAKKGTANAQEGNSISNYNESTEDFANPERGFYRYSHAKASNFVGLSLDQLNRWKGSAPADGGNYHVYSTLLFRYYELDLFKDKAIDPSFLQAVGQDFAVARQAGFKLIPRFTYTLAQNAGACPEGFICPPYGDAPKSIVLQHIGQLKPVLQDNADVLALVQMGFIGVWGEQYYTDHFGDASQNTPLQKLVDANWQDRIAVLEALLDAVPKDRMVQVRYPQIKQRYVYGIAADVNVLPLQEPEAFSQTDKARIGYHNDCFLASANDYGTFEDYGNSSSPRRDANAVLRAYKSKDSRYVAVGGETCSDTYSPQNDCEPMGRAQTEMREMHYSFLNSSYNNAVNNDWQTAGCMDSIKRNLGYRFVLKQAALPQKAARGSSLAVSFRVENKGYAAPYNKRPLKLVLRNKADGSEHLFVLTEDIRKWFTGAHEVKASVSLPESLHKGTYDLFLFLPDPYPSIEKRPEYAIRLANRDMWEAGTGYNHLRRVLEVN